MSNALSSKRVLSLCCKSWCPQKPGINLSFSLSQDNIEYRILEVVPGSYFFGIDPETGRITVKNQLVSASDTTYTVSIYRIHKRDDQRTKVHFLERVGLTLTGCSICTRTGTSTTKMYAVVLTLYPDTKIDDLRKTQPRIFATAKKKPKSEL